MMNLPKQGMRRFPSRGHGVQPFPQPLEHASGGSARSRRAPGSALVQVLIMGVLLLILVTLLMKSVAQHYQFGAIAAGQANSTQTTETSINAVEAAWSAGTNTGTVCTSYDWTHQAANPSPCPGAGSTNFVCCSYSLSCGQCSCTVHINGQSYPSVCVSAANALSVSQSYP